VRIIQVLVHDITLYEPNGMAQEIQMRSINVSLDSTTWELAKRKRNFSKWIRNKLLEDYNEGQKTLFPPVWKFCKQCGYGTNGKRQYCPKCLSPDVLEPSPETNET